MKREIKLKLEVNKINVSKLNNIVGAGDDNVPSVNSPCVITTEPKTIEYDNCKTGDTKTDRSLDCVILASGDRC
ncbi:hypothetical protein [uncultured Kordia sp.]|uniref:hypothetical protein n=1 Tax=uncultured Kordia sp. TaxID=507699 RepID=UPI002632529B|nr:hypothetical protein [uncultured Kordia sp.]